MKADVVLRLPNEVRTSREVADTTVAHDYLSQCAAEIRRRHAEQVEAFLTSENADPLKHTVVRYPMHENGWADVTVYETLVVLVPNEDYEAEFKAKGVSSGEAADRYPYTILRWSVRGGWPVTSPSHATGV